MNETAETLKQIYLTYGETIYVNKPQFKHLIQDKLNNSDVKMLLWAIELGVAAAVGLQVKSADDKDSIAQIQKHLVNEFMWQPDLAQKAIECFVYAKFSLTKDEEPIVNILNYNTRQFYIVNKVLIKYIGDDAKVKVPEGVTFIAEKAFYKCTNVTEIILPDSIVSIGKFAFDFCSSLHKIELSPNITHIGTGAFSRCSSLKHIDLPEQIVVLASGMFWGCSSLENVILPKGIFRISDFMFYNCNNLVNVEIPPNAHEIGKEAFSGCHKLVFIELPKGMLTIDEKAFNDCLTLEKFILPEAISSVGNNVFAGCYNLKTIIIHHSLKSIAGTDILNNKIQVLTPDNKLWNLLVS
ncbi:leucine-rich repeat domain-containing protein [Candidatus Epulonipiscium viviparus]|uniref:leucine-rich repeat domain-containing protein n=1 Tax=Candidatus Epulonipiscium viviparus TaxID=420336 RepID=UPI00016C0C61|nr:leucine-rich repeat domain-containing protein [Candidatus Epulopiscium viviparus]